jgi:hypothetical protein
MTLLLQQRSVTRYYCLHARAKAQIGTKLEQNYHQDALHLQDIKEWSVRFRAGRETVEDDERAGKPLQNDMGFFGFSRGNLIFPAARSIQTFTRHFRQFSEFGRPRDSFHAPSDIRFCPMSQKPKGSSLLDRCWM